MTTPTLQSWPRPAGMADPKPGDVTHGDLIPGAPFDLVFARLLLIHMTDPVAVVPSVKRIATVLTIRSASSMRRDTSGACRSTSNRQ